MPIGARKCGQQMVICSSPSVNKTPVGNNTPPLPYPVQCTLDSSNDVSSNVFFNENEAFTLGSNTNYVVGDAAGSIGGNSSGTTSREAEPIKHSKTVRVNKKEVIRCGDTFDMNAKNTRGTLTCSPPSKATPITDEGKVEAQEEISEEEAQEEKGWFDKLVDSAEESWEKAKEFAKEVNDEYKITTRIEGLGDAATGIAEGIVAVPMIMAPEPVTTAAGIGLGAVAVDTLQSGARQAWTGEATDSLISQGVEATATGLGASPEAASLAKDVASSVTNPKKILTKGDDIVEGATDMIKKDTKKKETKKDDKNNVAIKGNCIV